MWSTDTDILRPKERFEYYSIKDISIVKKENRYHLFYTASGISEGNQEYTMGYLSCENLLKANEAERIQLTVLKPDNGTYYCAPQIFYYEKQSLWYLIYQIRSEVGCYECAYSTNKDIENIAGWSKPKILLSRKDDQTNTNKWIDFWVISNREKVFLFYASNHKLAFRMTTLEDFPNGWSCEKSVEIEGAYEAPHIYHSLADGYYYLIFEGDRGENGRYFVLARNNDLGDINWEIVNSKWVSKENIENNSWTEMASHGEIIRKGNNELCEIEDIHHVEYLIQGVLQKDYNIEYPEIPWKVGVLKNRNVTRARDEMSQ